MIVMKFGGSSVESGEAIARLVHTVQEQLARKPVVVVSAMGRTTNRLLELAEEAAHGHMYFVHKHLAELQDYHLEEAGRVASGEALAALEVSLQTHFRDLRITLAEICNEGRDLTPALRDEIASFGERMSSEVVTAALKTSGIPAVHLDARQVILTDDQHAQAVPLYWETYAKLRRVVPGLAKDGSVVVMGGFIGSSERGATTTLGRGGSDLTASMVGAGISAEEIQIWTDVDGMLTCDPRVLAGGFRLRSISYEEATAMASSGAKVLHPESVQPAVRQLIPIVIRNSRKPEVEGTRIGPAAPVRNKIVKSISCRQDQNVLEIDGECAAALMQLCTRHGLPAELIGQQGSAAFLAIGNDYRYEELRTELNSCVQVHLQTNRAIITLVGDGIGAVPEISKRALAALKNIPASLISQRDAERTIRLIVPQAALERCTRLLHREFFKQVNPAAFAKVHEPVSGAPRRGAEKPEKRTNWRKSQGQRLVLVRQN